MSIRQITRVAMTAVVLAIPAYLKAAEWVWKWPAGVAEQTVQAEVCPFLYGKEWAYTLEIDDGPKLVSDIAQPLLARQHFTDAPPGVPGGKAMPFVGGVAVIVSRVGGNDTLLSWDDLRKLKTEGWGVINHGYAHKGRTWGDPPEILSGEQIRDDLFWSQAIIAAEMGEAPTHFVYPNGYTDYAKYLGEFGVLSGTRVGGSSVRFPYDPGAKHLDSTRSYLDDGNWKHWGKSEPMWDFPANPVAGPGQLVIDFTHGIDKPGTENHARWEQRLQTIGATYGSHGKDNVWSAPSGAIFDYVNARRQAKVSARREGITVAVPDTLAGSRLTVRLTGITGDLGEVPAGTIVFRQANTVWITTPVIGQSGARVSMPEVQCVYAGAPKDVVLQAPAKIAAVRMMQFGKPAPGFELKLAARALDGGSISLVRDEQNKLPDAWGTWHLFSLVPTREAVLANGVEVTADPAIQRMEIWVQS